MEKEDVIDKIVCKLYNKFHEENKELFKKDRIEYWHKANIYKNNELRKLNYNK
ncbi:hypothetical protein KY313_01285 [Candidatus Woesearchaeota archaeon]|jgi:hypothetical protein|nr:hypothetical protein [Candidatus Woesearchaeota archaeon]